MLNYCSKHTSLCYQKELNLTQLTKYIPMKNDFNAFSFITADDHSMITKSLSFILQDLYSNAEIFQINNIAGIIRILNTTKVDLLLLDISFPDGDTLSIIPTLKKIQPDLKILIFSGHEEDIYALRYINAGANGYLSKLSKEEEIKGAITEILNSGKYFSRNLQDKIMDNYIFNRPSNLLEQLSNRELEIARLLTEGYGNTEICNELNLQKSTVSTYKTRVFEKLEIQNIPDLIRLFDLYSHG